MAGPCADEFGHHQPRHQGRAVLEPATGHYYYLLGATDWLTSEQWAVALGGHLATINTANEQNWVFDNFAGLNGLNHNLWLGLTNNLSVPIYSGRAG